MNSQQQRHFRSFNVADGICQQCIDLRAVLAFETDFFSDAEIKFRNLLGQRYVYLYPGDDATVLRLQGHGLLERRGSRIELPYDRNLWEGAQPISFRDLT